LQKGSPFDPHAQEPQDRKDRISGQRILKKVFPKLAVLTISTTNIPTLDPQSSRPPIWPSPTRE
jgi:hypothetical protein